MRAEHWPYYSRRLWSLPFAAARRLTRSTCRGYSKIAPLVMGKEGLEIGGPSRIFGEGRLIPVYNRCRRIDSCNYSSQTIWSNAAERSGFGPQLGKQFVAEACSLQGIPEQTYDFVLASHVLEHIANPLRALEEWKRVLRPGGVIVAIVPDKRYTFDHKRPYTSFEHLEADYLGRTSEDDLTHMDEILALHDLALDPPAGTPEEFRKRCDKNVSVRAMHHHVFRPETLSWMFARVGMRTLSIVTERPEHIIGFAQSTVEMKEEENYRRH